MKKQICIFSNCLLLCWLSLDCQNTTHSVQVLPQKKIIEKKKVYKYVTSRSGLVMWKDAERKSHKLVTVPYANRVEVLKEFGRKKNISGTTGKWLLVRYKDKEGWVFGGFLVEHLLKRKKMHSLETLEENAARILSPNSKKAYIIALNEYKAALHKLLISQQEGTAQLKQACNLADEIPVATNNSLQAPGEKEIETIYNLYSKVYEDYLFHAYCKKKVKQKFFTSKQSLKKYLERAISRKDVNAFVSAFGCSAHIGRYKTLTKPIINYLFRYRMFEQLPEGFSSENESISYTLEKNEALLRFGDTKIFIQHSDTRKNKWKIISMQGFVTPPMPKCYE